MIVSINQPAYLPWLGYFHRIAISQLHIVLDHVQFEKNSFTNRNRIRTSDGSCWLTVPVKTKGRFGDLAIDSLEIADDSRWRRKHLDGFRTNYGRARCFAEHRAFLQDCYERDWRLLIELGLHQLTYLLDAFSISTPIVRSSELNVSGRKDELVLALCRAVGATEYVSGPFGRDYLREELFADAGIRVRYHDYNHPRYQQNYPGFEPNMCAFDLLLNHGGASRDVLMNASQAAIAP